MSLAQERVTLQLHPDKQIVGARKEPLDRQNRPDGSNGDRLQQVLEAYRVLSDPAARLDYVTKISRSEYTSCCENEPRLFPDFSYASRKGSNTPCHS